ncbi:MAG: hypothetical protein JNL58_04740 [Planctomyces sp.]|nr:hypothetical protein [Planctomyces sp.]
MSKGQPHNQFLAVIIDGTTIRAAENVSFSDVHTLLRVACEDPGSWNDAVLLWPRHNNDPEIVPDIRKLIWIRRRLEDITRLTEASKGWVVVDIVGRRLLTGGNWPAISIRGGEDSQSTKDAIRLNLPPWWEYRGQTEVATVYTARQSPLVIPNAKRDVLWGNSLIRFFADKLLTLARSRSESTEGELQASQAIWESLIGIHRDWLMTPQEELLGGCPRERLHAGMSWIDQLIFEQTLMVDSDRKLVPLHPRFSALKTAPPGRSEVVLYFDACRYLLSAGWKWLTEDTKRSQEPNSLKKLRQKLSSDLEAWWDLPFEGGDSHRKIVDTERTRIPRLAWGEDNIIDCDCPICRMMASEESGPGVLSIDGYHLELEDDFVFSLCPTREIWESEFSTYNDGDDEDEDDEEESEDEDVQDCEQPAGPTVGQRGTDPHATNDGLRSRQPDEFGSVWKHSYVNNSVAMGGTFGYLSLAFLLAEIIAFLQTLKNAQSEIDLLNSTFTLFRKATEREEMQAAADDFRAALEDVAGRHDELTGRVADLQSRIDEQLRVATAGSQ